MPSVNLRRSGGAQSERTECVVQGEQAWNPREGAEDPQNLGDSRAHLCPDGRLGPWKALGSGSLSTVGGTTDPDAWAEPED